MLELHSKADHPGHLKFPPNCLIFVQCAENGTSVFFTASNLFTFMVFDVEYML